MYTAPFYNIINLIIIIHEDNTNILYKIWIRLVKIMIRFRLMDPIIETLNPLSVNFWLHFSSNFSKQLKLQIKVFSYCFNCNRHFYIETCILRQRLYFDFQISS